MTIAAQLRARLVADSNLAAVVGARVHANMAPQGVSLPYITFRCVSPAERSRGHGGGDRLALSERWQIDVFDDDVARCDTIAGYISAALDEWTAPAGSPEILLVTVERPLWTFEPQPLLHHLVVDLFVNFRE